MLRGQTWSDRKASLLLLQVGAFGLSACTLLADFSGRPSPAGVVDAGADAPDSASLLDAGEDADADAAGSPCSTAHLFCDDFDTGDRVERWDGIGRTAGPLTLDTSHAVSPPRSLLAMVEPGDGVRHTHLSKLLTVPSRTARVSLDMRTEGPNGDVFGEIDLVEIRLFPPPTGYSSHAIALGMEKLTGSRFGVFRMPDAAPGQEDVRPITLPLGSWVHVEIRADFTATPPRTTVAFDGTVLAEVPLVGTELTSIELRVGAPYVEAAQLSWAVSFDNAIVDP